MIGEVSALMGRELRKLVRSPALLLMTMIQPVLWMGLYGKAFNLTGMFSIPEDLLSRLPPDSLRVVSSAFNAALTRFFGSPEVDYFSYVATGMAGVIVLFVSVFSGMSVAWDRRLGFINKLLAAPISRFSIVLSKVLASAVRAIVQSGLVVLTAIALGLRLDTAGPVAVLLGFTALALLSIALSSLIIAITLRLKNWEYHVALANLLNLPLMFTSTALYPRAIVPEWMRPITDINPLTHAIEVLRSSLLHGPSFDLMGSLNHLAYLAAFSALCVVVGSYFAYNTLNAER
ncbi:MAG: ABC transporter permease [Nitrososphaeria archaeon]|nr:ABC transporter permease [Nitrososphaeria archaeon]MDW8043633.1 ABC transporter permease [Nitrososphaerota archaeon]